MQEVVRPSFNHFGQLNYWLFDSLFILSDGSAGIFLQNYTKPNFRKATHQWSPRGSIFKENKNSGWEWRGLLLWRPHVLKLIIQYFFFIYETIFQWRCSKCSRLLLLMVSLPNSNFLLSILGLFSWWRANSIYFIDPSPPPVFHLVCL